VGGIRVGPVARQQYLEQMRDRYAVAGRTARSALLDEAVAMTGYHRKALIRRFTRPLGPRRRRRGRPQTYGPTVVAALRALWQAAGYPWAVRLKALLPVWVPRARRRLHLTRAVEAQLQQISPRQMDRLLQTDKRQIRRRLYGRTKPGTLLKHQVPLRTDRWDVTTPGWTEVDLVAHSGDRAEGEFAHTVNQTDIVTTWVESRAVLGKSQVHVQQALEALRHGLPFRLRGIDSDNGSEFLNAHLVRYCAGLEIQFTRGRPYKKDDNAHIEQKNWTHVRKLVGYERYDTEPAVAALNTVYAELRLFQNLFLPTVKLVRKDRVGARTRRRYDLAQTPLDRVRACPEADHGKVAALVALRARLDPFVLSARIDRLLERVYALAHRPTVPGRATRPVADAGPVDAETAPTRSLEARKERGLPHRPPASLSARSSVTRLMARRCQPR
jgi:hypothetical protein